MTSEPTVTDTADDAATSPSSRIEVVAGGEPSAEELAAIVVALTPAARDEEGPPPVPAWARAALLEGVGHRRPTRPSDLAAALRLG